MSPPDYVPHQLDLTRSLPCCPQVTIIMIIKIYFQPRLAWSTPPYQRGWSSLSCHHHHIHKSNIDNGHHQMWDIISIKITRMITTISFSPSPYQSQEGSLWSHPQVIIIIRFIRVFHLMWIITTQWSPLSRPQCDPFNNQVRTIIPITRRSSPYQWHEFRESPLSRSSIAYTRVTNISIWRDHYVHTITFTPSPSPLQVNIIFTKVKITISTT